MHVLLCASTEAGLFLLDFVETVFEEREPSERAVSSERAFVSQGCFELNGMQLRIKLISSAEILPSLSKSKILNTSAIFWSRSEQYTWANRFVKLSQQTRPSWTAGPRRSAKKRSLRIPGNYRNSCRVTLSIDGLPVDGADRITRSSKTRWKQGRRTLF